MYTERLLREKEEKIRKSRSPLPSLSKPGVDEFGAPLDVYQKSYETRKDLWRAEVKDAKLNNK
ncbi:MAG: hypothetical protein PHE77_00035 [Candidatus Pacebacteria bacterium]|nr:hypothetical protein [Candidatus Paceibacterota bacterium]